MRTWVYTYKTADGLRHEGELCAPTKDAVYSTLREKGIRAIKVSERIQPLVRKGFAGLRKRDWTLAVGCCLVLFAIGYVFILQSGKGNSGRARLTPEIASGVVQIARPHPRHYIDFPSDLDIAKVFRYAHEVYLAQFARPGVAVQTNPVIGQELAQDFYDNLNAVIVIYADDSKEVAELKRVVAGMKDDAKKYLGVAGGVEKLVQWLSSRQRMEVEYRSQVIGDLQKRKSGEDYASAVNDANRLLSAMGLEQVHESGKNNFQTPP